MAWSEDRCAIVSRAGRWLLDNMGLTGFDCVRDLLACVIQWPRSDIQWHLTNDELVIEIEAALAIVGVDAEFEALCAEYSDILV